MHEMDAVDTVTQKSVALGAIVLVAVLLIALVAFLVRHFFGAGRSELVGSVKAIANKLDHMDDANQLHRLENQAHHFEAVREIGRNRDAINGILAHTGLTVGGSSRVRQTPAQGVPVFIPDDPAMSPEAVYHAHRRIKRQSRAEQDTPRISPPARKIPRKIPRE